MVLILGLALVGCTQRPRARLVAVPLDAPTGSRAAPTGALSAEGANPQIHAAADPARNPAAPLGRGVSLGGAGGEWLDFTALLSGEAATLRALPLTPADDASSAAGARQRAGAERRIDIAVYRVVDIPADTNRAGFLRLYGGVGGTISLPRALVPLARGNGRFAVPAALLGRPVKLWIDLQLPRGLERGLWRTEVQALGPSGQLLARLPITVTSHGFDLPLERSLRVSGTLPWDRLVALWPERFERVSPALLSRADVGAQAAVERLDQLVGLAQSNRLQVTVPAISATVKWPAGRQPEADWSGFDDVIGPWLTGVAFVDGVGLRAWPVPTPDRMERYSVAARREYWQTALAHLAGRQWLDRCVVMLDGVGERTRAADLSLAVPTFPVLPGLSPTERLLVSEEAARIARAYPEGRIVVPLEADQIRFAGDANPELYPPQEAGRLMIRAESLVTDQPDRPWPAGLPPPQRYLDLRGPTPVPMPGPGGSAADVRARGWLAFLRGATHLEAGPAVPEAQDLHGTIDPAQLVWFYPGEWFGASEPISTVQLKWLRRAQQDYEYLRACSDRLEETYARVVARALTRPVRARAGEPADPLLPLLAGTADPALWEQGLVLVAEKVAIADEQLRHTLPPRFTTNHTNRTTAWLAPRERPVPFVITTHWNLSAAGQAAEEAVARLQLRLGVGIYNPSDAPPEGMSLSFVEYPGGESPGALPMPGAGAGDRATWLGAESVSVPPIATYEVGQFPIGVAASVDALARRFPTFQQVPLRLAVRNPDTGAVATVEAVVPAVVLDRRQAEPVVDGMLGEWSGEEALIDGRMVLMHDRPALQSGEVRRTERPAQAYAAWTPQGLHIAFRFEGARVALMPGGIARQTRNFVDTEYRRVWGEDVCELLIQPVWPGEHAAGGDAAGEPPLLHVICKPEGAFAQRRVDRRTHAESWRPFESGMRYAATTDGAGVWRAEVLVPWSALREDGAAAVGVPAMLRFNLSHHDGETGQSASWAGPVDFGSDEHFTGALVLRVPEPAGPGH